MAVASIKVEFPRRQAMLSIRERQEVDRPEIPFERMMAEDMPWHEYIVIDCF